MVVKNAKGRPILLNMVQAIHENKQYLGDIDGLIGDGDHGMNMNKGFVTYGERLGEKSLKECLCQMFGPPYWPLPLDQLPALIRFHEIQAGDVFLLEDQIRVQTLSGVHPGGSILYRLEEATQESEPASVVYGLDCELTDAMFQKLKEFAGACGLLICDACYTEAELLLRQGWGHGSIERCRKLRQASGAQQALFMHYERSYQDTFLREQEKISLAQDPACLFAREGMALKVHGQG